MKWFLFGGQLRQPARQPDNHSGGYRMVPAQIGTGGRSGEKPRRPPVPDRTVAGINSNEITSDFTGQAQIERIKGNRQIGKDYFIRSRKHEFFTSLRFAQNNKERSEGITYFLIFISV